jgi:hypothetical protein
MNIPKHLIYLNFLKKWDFDRTIIGLFWEYSKDEKLIKCRTIVGQYWDCPGTRWDHSSSRNSLGMGMKLGMTSSTRNWLGMRFGAQK